MFDDAVNTQQTFHTHRQGSLMGTTVLGLDIGSNSVGSALIDLKTGQITAGVSVFPAGVDETDDKRGEPKNAKRRMTRRTRITLARRAMRKRLMRLKLLEIGLLPETEEEFKTLLEITDPWELRRKGLVEELQPYEFGRVLLHLSQRRGALGFDADVGDKGSVKKAIVDLQLQMLHKFSTKESQASAQKLQETIERLSKKKRTDLEEEELESAQDQLKQLCRALLADGGVTVGRFIAELRDERQTAITTPDRRKVKKGKRVWRKAVRNKGGNFEFHADRAMIRDEFAKLWTAQKKFNGQLAAKLTDELRLVFDDDSRDSDWRHRGLLFGQRMQSWDLGTLGRCVLEPTERCAPHADMYASRYLVVETVNNLKIIERGKAARPLTREERSKIKNFLSGPLGTIKSGKQKGLLKKTASVTDLREQMGWGPARKDSHFHFNIEADEDRVINTDWFSREIVHGAITSERWSAMSENIREGINRAILKFDPDDDKQAERLKNLVMEEWAGLSAEQADRLVATWKKRPRPDAKRLNMSRHAVQNLLVYMDRDKPWPDPKHPVADRWLTQIEARKRIANDDSFVDVVTGKSLDTAAKARYATGAKGSTAKDRHYMRKHVLKKDGEPVFGRDGLPLHAPPPAPLISNPVVRKAVHEVKRHVVNYMVSLGIKPDQVYVELAREAKMGKVNSDKLLFKNRLRNRIRNNIAEEFKLDSVSSTQRRAAVDRVILAVQQGGICPLCANQVVKTTITPRMAAGGTECEVAHILPRASGGHNGLNNLVLAHKKCNQDMGRRTPRDFWNDRQGFDEGIAKAESTYASVERPKPAEVKNASGNSLWVCYFDQKEIKSKIEQFKKDISDIKGMTDRQLAATTYASRQVMTYLSDALFESKGLPERGGERLVFASDGQWTSRLRREWGLFFDEHKAKAKGLAAAELHQRKEKDRGDHRHHAIDAIVIALCSESIRKAWDNRELEAEKIGINSANEEEVEAYRKDHPLPFPSCYTSREEFREAVRKAVYGDGEYDRPVCHRPVKRKLIGALHEETLLGPIVVDDKLTDSFSARKSVFDLTPNHLRVPDGWAALSAKLDDPKVAEVEKRQMRRALAGMQDPSPGKPGLVRDRALRDRIRKCLFGAGADPDAFTANDIKKVIEADKMKHASGVPIRSVVLLRTMSDPVIIDRKKPSYTKNCMLPDADPVSKRAYLGGNNHHIEIRVKKNSKGIENWSGRVVTAFEAAQRKLGKLRAFREAGIPKSRLLRALPVSDRERIAPAISQIEMAYALVDRRDDEKSGHFVMSVCEGEILFMRNKKNPDEVGYFVVAKLDKPQSIVVVPHWDARSATERKDSEGKKVEDSKREQFAVTPSDLKTLAPPGYEHAVKVRVSPLGEITVLQKD